MSKNKDWLVVGVSGVTCGGKTTFAAALHKLLPGATIINQDKYFLPIDDTRHTLIPNLNHINWEITSSLDIEKMRNDIEKILSSDPSHVQLPLLIIEGFLIFTDVLISSLCKQKLFFTLTKEECWARRSVRTYDPADVPGYFEQIVWPEYERHLQIALTINPDVTLIHGTRDIDTLAREVKLLLDSELNDPHS